MRALPAARMPEEAPALMASCTDRIERPRFTSWGASRRTCETMSDTTGSARPATDSERSLSMQAA